MSRVAVPSGGSWHAVSPQDVAIGDVDQGPLEPDSDIIGEMYDIDVGIGVIALARNSDAGLQQRVVHAPEVGGDHASAIAENLQQVAGRSDYNGFVLATVSTYSASEVLTATEQLINHFEGSGFEVAFGYDPRIDGIVISGDLSEDDVVAIPDVEVASYVEAGIYGESYGNDDGDAPFLGGAPMRSHNNGE